MINISLREYKFWISGLIVILVFLIIFSFQSIMDSTPFRFSFTDNFAIDSSLIFVLVCIVPILGILIGSYILCPLLLLIHKKLFGKSKEYGIEDNSNNIRRERIFIRLIYPALFILNLGLIIYDEPIFQNLILTTDILDSGIDLLKRIMTLIVSFPILSLIAITLFEPAYLLIDSKIIYINKKNPKREFGIIEVRSVGMWYLFLLRGYSGISVIINYIEFILYMYSNVNLIGWAWIMVIMWPLIPLILVVMLFPVYIFSKTTLKHRKHFLLDQAGKLRIKDTLEINTKKI